MKAILHRGPRDGTELELPCAFLSFDLLGDPSDPLNAQERYTLDAIKDGVAHYRLASGGCDVMCELASKLETKFGINLGKAILCRPPSKQG